MTLNTHETLAAFKAAQKSPIDDPAFAGLAALARGGMLSVSGTIPTAAR